MVQLLQQPRQRLPRWGGPAADAWCHLQHLRRLPWQCETSRQRLQPSVSQPHWQPQLQSQLLLHRHNQRRLRPPLHRRQFPQQPHASVADRGVLLLLMPLNQHLHLLQHLQLKMKQQRCCSSERPVRQLASAAETTRVAIARQGLQQRWKKKTKTTSQRTLQSQQHQPAPPVHQRNSIRLSHVAQSADLLLLPPPHQLQLRLLAPPTSRAAPAACFAQPVLQPALRPPQVVSTPGLSQLQLPESQMQRRRCCCCPRPCRYRCRCHSNHQHQHQHRRRN